MSCGLCSCVQVIPELNGKLTGMAFRVPTQVRPWPLLLRLRLLLPLLLALVLNVCTTCVVLVL